MGAGGWTEVTEPERVGFVRVANTLDGHETPPTVKNDVELGNVAKIFHLGMMKAVLASLEAGGLVSTAQVQGDADQDLKALAAMWPRDEAESSEGWEAAVLRSSVREAKQKSYQGTGGGKASTGEPLNRIKVVSRQYPMKRERFRWINRA